MCIENGMKTVISQSRFFHLLREIEDCQIKNAA